MIEVGDHLRREVGAQVDGDVGVVEDARDHRGVALGRHALEAMREVVVVVVETNRQALEDARGQLRRVDPPLLDGVGLEERFVEAAAHEAQCLLLEASRRFDGQVGLAFDERPRLGRPQRLAEELIDGEQVDRQRIHGTAGRRLHPVHERLEFHESIDVGPDLLVIGMEDVRSVDVQHDAGVGIALGMAIAGDVAAALEEFDAVPAFSQLARDHRARQPSPGHSDVFPTGH